MIAALARPIMSLLTRVDDDAAAELERWDTATFAPAAEETLPR